MLDYPAGVRVTGSRPLATYTKHEVRVLGTGIAQYVGDRLLNVWLGICPESLEYGKDGLRIQFDEAPKALACRTPDLQVPGIGPPKSLAYNRRGMALADLDQRRGRNLSRLPLIAGCKRPQFWEHCVWLDAAPRQEPFDVLNLHDHCEAYPGFRPNVPKLRRGDREAGDAGCSAMLGARR